MKKIVSLLLVLLLVAAILPTGALAADVVLSPQNLRVDGKRIECEKYNIDGSNYFKLRDIALVLNGTGSQFSVNWDGEKKLISLVTGEAYEPNGSELDLSGGDKSATAVPSTATLLIDGVERSDLSAYNLDGNNFFKLRDLGDALGFQVNYDKPSNTAIVISKAWSYPVEWLTEEWTTVTNDGYYEHAVYTYDEGGRILSYVIEGEDYVEQANFSYNELGQELEKTYDVVYEYMGEKSEYHDKTVYSYNIWGQLERADSSEAGDVVNYTTYTYDDDGNQICVEYVTNAGVRAYYSEYDENGHMVKYITAYDGEVSDTINYVVDADGNTLREESIDADGTVYYVSENVWQDGRMVKNTYTSAYGSNTTTYVYDDAGRLIETLSENSGGYSSRSTNIYDEQGNLLQEEWSDGEYSSVTVYTYDEQGRVLRQEASNSEGVGVSYSYEYTYDADGNELSYVYESDGIRAETTYSYDRAARKMTAFQNVVYPAAEAMYFYDEWISLEVGDYYYVYTYFQPYNSVGGSVTYTSSDPTVVTVDEDGMLIAVANGEAVVTATSESGLTATCTVYVGGVG